MSFHESDESMARWGIFLSMISAGFTSTGLCLQKLHFKSQKLSSESGISLSDSKYIVGIVYVAVGLILKGFVYAMLPQVTFALMSAQTVLYSSLLEYFFLKNQISLATVVCLSAIALGIVIGINGSNISDPSYSFGDVWNLFFSFDALFFSVLCCAIFVSIPTFLAERLASSSDEVRLGIASCVTGLACGLFGTFIKSVFEVLYFNVYYSNSKTYSYGVILLIIPATITGLYKMKLIGDALKEFPSWKFLPLYQSAAIVLNTLCGLIYFNEYTNTLFLYYFGLFLVSGGVACLMLRANSEGYRELTGLPDEDIVNGRGLKESEMGLWDSDEEDDGELEEFHVTGGLGNILPSKDMLGRLFGSGGKSAAVDSEYTRLPTTHGSNSAVGARNDYQDMFVGSLERHRLTDNPNHFGFGGKKATATAPKSYNSQIPDHFDL